MTVPLLQKGCVLIFPQIILRPRRNARLLDPNKPLLHQPHSHSIRLLHFRRQDHRSQTLLPADDEDTRGRGVICPLVVLTCMGDLQVAKEVSLRADSLLHQVKGRLESSLTRLLLLQILCVDDQEDHTQSRLFWSKASRDHNCHLHRNLKPRNNKRNATLNTRLGRR